MAIPQRVVHQRRATITALPLYYSGHLLKKQSIEKDFKKYYAELRGSALFLYKDDTQDTYTEKLDLEQVKSMWLDTPCQIKTPPVVTLSLHTGEVQLKMDSPDTAEEWQGYIHTVVKKAVPTNLMLLPGQKWELQELLVQEKKRNGVQPTPPLPPRPSFLLSVSSSSPSPAAPKDSPEGSCSEMPVCFYDVSRQEAQQMLEDNPEYGSIIIRPSTLANNYALTLRQQTTSGVVVKNYRLTSSNSGIIIELDTAVTVSSLNKVLEYFLVKTDYRLRPYIMAQPYDTRIEVPPVPKCIAAPGPKEPSQAKVAPIWWSKPTDESSDSLPPPPSKVAEGEYVIPKDDDDDDDDDDKKSVDE